MRDASNRLGRSRFAVSTIFFVNGLVLASWVPHIPAVKARHAIGDGELGLVLLSMAVGAVLALPSAGWLVGRFGSRAMTSLAALSLCLALPLPLLSPGVTTLSFSLAILGACNGTLDVSMNSQAVVVEERYRRSIMSSFHGLFSAGGLAGAAVASLALWRGYAPIEHVIAMSVACLLAVACALRWLVPSPARAGRASAGFVKPKASLLALGLLAFMGLLAEGAMADWSAVYLRDSLASTAAVAAAGFGAFSIGMAAGRFAGDRLTGAYGPVRTLRASAALAAGGLGAALVIGKPFAVIVGCGFVGLGIANIIPVLFSAAGRFGGNDPGAALAAVATTGYFGFLAGPPLIGFAAEATSLPLALGIVSLFCALIATFAGVTDTTRPVADPRATDRAVASM
jgi:MFS family permease